MMLIDIYSLMMNESIYWWYCCWWSMMMILLLMIDNEDRDEWVVVNTVDWWWWLMCCCSLNDSTVIDNMCPPMLYPYVVTHLYDDVVTVCDERSNYIHHRPKNRWIVYGSSLRVESLYNGRNGSKMDQIWIEIA